jgi:hypothetical protein
LLLRRERYKLDVLLRLRTIVAFAVAGGLSMASASADEELSLGERARLARGATVARPVTIESGEHRLVGGITYTVLSASLSDLVPLFDDPSAYQEVLPRTKEAKVTRDGTVRHLAMRTGNAVVDGVYTLYLQQVPSSSPNAQEMRFWLDPRAPHDIDDAYGYFRFEALPAASDGSPRTLLTYAVAIDVGPGIVRELFEERVRAASLTVPQALVARVARDHDAHHAQDGLSAAR